jgi:hypothetical protein
MVVDVADAIDWNWDVEELPDPDLLYMRVHFTQIYEDGALKPGAFRDQGDSMSTDREKYSIPELTRARAQNNPMANAVVSMRVGAVREIPGQTVLHSPIPSNQAHTDVIGNKKGGDPQARVLFTRIYRMEIPYIPQV